MAWRHVALAMALLAAGCLGASDEAQPAPSVAGARTHYFHSAMTLAEAPEPNASAVRTGGFFQAWAAGDDYPTWIADPLPAHALVRSAVVTLFVQATGPVLESGRFPDIMVYGGSGDAWMAYGERRDQSAFTAGRVYELQVELELPPGGLWLSPDVGFGLKVVPVMMQQEERADVEILLGGDTASRVDWRVEALDVPPAQTRRGNASGEVVGTIYAGPAAPPTTSHHTPVSLPQGTRYLIAWMNTSQNVGIPDLDLSLVAPGGQALATSGTPTPREAIRVAAPNLPAAGEYALVVTTAGSPRASFTLEWVVGSAS